MKSWPLFALRLRTPLLELRLPTDEELDWLAEAAYDNVLNAEEKEFLAPWTQLADGEFQRGLVQHHWEKRGSWRPNDWSLNLGVFPKGEEMPVGGMSITSKDFALSKSVKTGSWLLPEWRGKGLGKEMRTAVLYLAFNELNAEEACSSAHLLNQASRGVSGALGYHEDGNKYNLLHGHRVDEVRLRCLRENFRPACDVQVEGLGVCRELFGLPAS